MLRSDLNRRLGYPKVKLRWLRQLLYRRFLDWYRLSSFCRQVGSGMQGPLDSVFRVLELKGLKPDPVLALDVFGGMGLFKTVDLIRFCDHVTHIEIEESLSHHARRVLPAEKTDFLVADSILAIRNGELPRKNYNLVHVDNECGRFGPGYCENFDLFPGLLDCVADEAVLVLNVWLDIRARAPDTHWLERRREFFGLAESEDPARISYQTAERAYVSRIPAGRFTVRDVFPVPHFGETIYIVLCVSRSHLER